MADITAAISSAGPVINVTLSGGAVIDAKVESSGPPGPKGDGVPDFEGVEDGSVLTIANGEPSWEPPKGGEGLNFQPGNALELKDGVLNVLTASNVEADNTLPITAAAVSVTVGNIEALLESI